MRLRSYKRFLEAGTRSPDAEKLKAYLDSFNELSPIRIV
jgi:hypothetical protein